jgi:hypothetical protein
VEAEPSFMDSVTQSSLALSSSLEQIDFGVASKPAEVVTGRHQAIVLEKLVQSREQEDEIPTEL